VTDQRILIDALEKAGVIIAEHIEPRHPRGVDSERLPVPQRKSRRALRRRPLLCGCRPGAAPVLPQR
jgi:hypothetical protein